MVRVRQECSRSGNFYVVMRCQVQEPSTDWGKYLNKIIIFFPLPAKMPYEEPAVWVFLLQARPPLPPGVAAGFIWEGKERRGGRDQRSFHVVLSHRNISGFCTSSIGHYLMGVGRYSPVTTLRVSFPPHCVQQRGAEKQNPDGAWHQSVRGSDNRCDAGSIGQKMP